jgi:hypothetical protein
LSRWVWPQLLVRLALHIELISVRPAPRASASISFWIVNYINEMGEEVVAQAKLAMLRSSPPIKRGLKA